MARFQDFARELRLATAGLEQGAISAELAKFARTQVAEVIASGAGSTVYDRFVNGRPGVSEDLVEAPGPIVYSFVWWEQLIGFALAYLRGRAPRLSGRYANSFIVMVGGRRVAEDTELPAIAEVVITNTQPYSRKLHMAAVSKRAAAKRVRAAGGKMRAANPLFEQTRQQIFRTFPGLIDADVKFLPLPGGYVLKGRQRVIAAKQNRKSSAYRAGRARLASRRDRVAGEQMTYPSLVMRMRLH